jgi:Tfp pilus tip-associated adhesin PilY1
VLGCEYKLPAPASGTLDLTRVNVQYTAGNGQVTFFGNVPNRAACDPQQGGWYYDVDTATGGKPTSIVTCDSTCGLLTGDPAGQLDVVLGCTTIVE